MTIIGASFIPIIPISHSLARIVFCLSHGSELVLVRAHLQAAFVPRMSQRSDMSSEINRRARLIAAGIFSNVSFGRSSQPFYPPPMQRCVQDLIAA